MSQTSFRLNGMQKFSIIWFGQMLSMFGTATTRFALLVWAYQQTGQATTTALLGFFSFILYLLVSPVAGVIVDRFDRRLIMILADFGAGLMTLVLLILHASNQLQISHLYLAEFLVGGFDAFQVNAYNTSVTSLVPKEQYGRTSGMRSLAYSASQVAAPLLAGVLLALVGLNGVMLIDILSFGIGITPLLFIAIPHPVVAQHDQPQASFWQDITLGFRYILQRPGLLGLLLNFVAINLTAAITYFAILAPMVLARSGNDELALGTVQSAMGVAGILGGIVMSVWGGPKKRIHGIFLIGAISFLTGDMLMAVGRTPLLWALGGFIGTFFVPIIVGCDRAIWQSKVEPEVQGRVFSVQGMISDTTMPIGYLIAGPLADRLFEPAMQPGGALVPFFGGLVGTGTGAGMGLMFFCTAILGTIVCLSGYLIPSVRNVEKELPDHSKPAEVQPETELAEALA